MKQCSKCRHTKPETEFYFRKTENRLQTYCKSCFNSYCIKRWSDRKLAVIEQFGGKCFDCSLTYHPAVYDFHHLSPVLKEATWDKMRLMSESKMQAELSKCVMLCANCHRLRHALSN